MARLVDGSYTGDDRTEYQEDQCQRGYQGTEYHQQEISIASAFELDSRSLGRTEQCIHQDIDHVQADQNQTGDQRAQKHLTGTGRSHREFRRYGDFTRRRLVQSLAHGARLIGGTGQLVCQNDQHDGWWNNLTEASRKPLSCRWPAPGNNYYAA